MPKLLTETAELALDLLEKNNCLLPFCKVLMKDGETLIICADSERENTMEQITHSVREELYRRIKSGKVSEFAFCKDLEIKYQNDPNYHRVLQIEFQNGTPESAIYHFPLTVEAGKSSIASQYVLADLKEKLI